MRLLAILQKKVPGLSLAAFHHLLIEARCNGFLNIVKYIYLNRKLDSEICSLISDNGVWILIL